MRVSTPLALLTAGAVALSTLALSAGTALADSAPADTPSVGAVTVPFDANTPSDLTIVDSGNRTVWLDWNAPLDADGSSRDGLTGYKIKTVVYANPDGLPTPSLGSASIDFANSAGKVAGLTNGVTYAFAVAAVVNGTTSAYSTPAVVGAPDPAGVPADFHITDSGNGRVNLDWLAVDEATGYRIKTVVVNANGVANPAAGTARIDTGNSLGYVTALTTGVTYGFTVSAIVDGQDGPASAQLTHTMQAVPGTPGTPVADTLNTATPITSTSIQVRWSAPAAISGAPAPESYRVEYTPTVVGDPTVISVPATQTWAKATGLVKGASYRIRVAAVNNAGKGLYSPARTYTATNKTNQVRSLTAERSQDGTVIYLDWLAPSNNGGQAPTSYSLTQTPAGGVKTIDVRNTSARMTGLDPQTTYRYTVKAVNDAGIAATGVSISVLAGHVEFVSEPTVEADGSLLVSFSALDDDSLDYQVQAYQVIPTGRLAATEVVDYDDIACADGVCTATWHNFASVLNDRPWSVRARATNGVDTYSTWATVTPPAPAGVKDNTVALFTANGWHLSFRGPWAERAALGVSKMLVNGSSAPQGASGPLGIAPGNVLVQFVGIGGTSSYVYNLSGPPAPDFNNATGGTVSEYTDADGKHWRVHTFTSSADFTVLDSVQPFDVLIVGGGGSGGSGGTGWDNNSNGDGGDGGQVVSAQSLFVPEGAYPVTVAAPGARSAFMTYAASGGVSGSSGDAAGRSRNGNPIPGVVSSISGTAVEYGRGGYGNGSSASAPAHTGGGGSGGPHHSGGQGGGSGASGVVIVRYQIAP